MRDPAYVFTYGTLREGQPNAHLLDGYTDSAVAAVAPGLALYTHPDGCFPYAVPVRGHSIVGTLYALAPHTVPLALARLDCLEGHHPNSPETSHYVRTLHTVQTSSALVTAWVYLAGHRAAATLTQQHLISDGDWLTTTSSTAVGVSS